MISAHRYEETVIEPGHGFLLPTLSDVRIAQVRAVDWKGIFGVWIVGATETRPRGESDLGYGVTLINGGGHCADQNVADKVCLLWYEGGYHILNNRRTAVTLDIDVAG